MSLEMYQQNIMDHYKNPRNVGEISDTPYKAHAANPLCGDELDFFLTIADGKVSEVKFKGRGCTISQAAASMLTAKLVGLSQEEVVKLPTDYTIQLLGVPVNPARMKCATLSLEAVQQAVGHH